MAAARAFMAERKAELPVAVIAYNPEITVLTDFTTGGRRALRGGREDAGDRRGHAHLRRAHRGGTAREGSRLCAHDRRPSLRRPSPRRPGDPRRDGGGARTTRTSASSRSACSRPSTTRRRSRAWRTRPAARTWRARRPSSSSRSSRRSASSSRTSTSSRYRSLLPPNVEGDRTSGRRRGSPPRRRPTRRPRSTSAPQGTFERELDRRGHHVAVADDLRRRRDSRARRLRAPLRDRRAQPLAAAGAWRSTSPSRARRSRACDAPRSPRCSPTRAQRTVGGQRWWQRFETDVELGGFKLSPLAIAGWTIVGGHRDVARRRDLLPVAVGAPRRTRRSVRDALHRVAQGLARCARRSRSSSPTTSTCWQAPCAPVTPPWVRLSVMVDSAIEPSKTEFRRVLQDEQLGVPLDDALMVMARRMESYDAEQVALVMRLQREAGGNTAEVLDRVAEVIRGRMELQAARRRADGAGAHLPLDPHRASDLRAARPRVHGRRVPRADAVVARRQDLLSCSAASWCSSARSGSSKIAKMDV